MGVNARGIQEIYTCTFCDDDFATEKEVKYHVYTNHVSLNQCRYCQDYFDSRINLIRHLSIIHAELAHRCIYCSAVFKLHDELATHIQTNHR